MSDSIDAAPGLKQRLRAGQHVTSLMLSEEWNPNVGLMLRAAGVDSFILDMEHGAFSWPQIAAAVTVGRAAGLHPVVRVPEIRRESIMHALDQGAEGVLAPYITTREQVEQLVAIATYPPGRGARRRHAATPLRLRRG